MSGIRGILQQGGELDRWLIPHLDILSRIFLWFKVRLFLHRDNAHDDGYRNRDF